MESSPTLRLSDLASFIRRVFALNLPEAVWVTAEIAQANYSREHCWLTLVEKGTENDEILAQLEAVAWAGTLRKLRGEHGRKLVNGLLATGTSVRLRITTSFHERYGLRLVVEEIDPAHTIGLLEQRRLTTLETLHTEGLIGRNAGLPLPEVPRRLAIISSDVAAGLADFYAQLKGNPYGYVFKSDLYTAAMQGAQTSEEIIRRLRQIDRRREEYDLIVIVRGGGGKTDLAAFDGEELCRAVARASLPVIAGIGHEIDETVLDRVVHRSLKTPTATAVFLIETLVRAEHSILQKGRSIYRLAAGSLAAATSTLDRAARAARDIPASTLKTEHLRTAAQQRLLEALRPETTLARGYALVSQNGKLITEAEEVGPGEVKVRLKKGVLKLKS